MAKDIFDKTIFDGYRVESLTESAQDIIPKYNFDGSTKTTVFISHKHDDLDETKGLIGLLERKYNIKAYIDSLDKSMPKKTSGETASKIKQRINRSDADYDYAKRRNDLFLEDLKRYRISALVIDDFSEITEILQEIERRLNQNNIFISGSAEEYGVFTKEEAENLIKLLSARLIQDEFNIISGFGVGVGSAVITGALEEIYMHNTRINNQRLLLRPFPQGKEARVLWQQYREDMISRAGISLYIFGNKKQDDNIVEANGVKTEFDIAIDAKHIVIPVGCTGYMAQKLWEQINLNIEEYYGKVNDEVRKTFQSLNTKMSNDEIVSNIVKLIKLLRR